MDAFHTYYLDVVKNRYADFEGRARRREYWMFALFNVVVAVGFVAVAGVLGLVSEILAGLFFLLYYLYALAVLVPSLAFTVRRLHDTGRSGWWVLVSVVPFVGGFVLLYFMVVEGDAGPNAYGPDPKDPVSEGAGIGEFAGVLDR